MKTVRRSSLAIALAAISTAALGPGALYKSAADTAVREVVWHAPTANPASPALQRLVHTAMGQPAFGTLPAALADAAMADPEFFAVDFVGTLPPGLGTRIEVGLTAAVPGPFRTPVDEAAMHSAPAQVTGGAAGLSGRSTRLARNGGQVAAYIGPVSGFSASPSTIADGSGLALGDPGEIIAKPGIVPPLAFVPAFTDGELAGPAAERPAAAAPEPATALLLGFGLAGILAARRIKRTAARRHDRPRR